MTGESLARSSFHARFTASLVELMRRLTVDALERASTSRKRLRNAFRPFVEVLAVDSSLVRLHARLKKEYPSIWTNHTEASAKLTMVANVVARGPRTLSINPGSRILPGRAFQEHPSPTGYFLCRMKKQGNPLVIRSHRPEHEHLVGKKLREHQDSIKQDVIDIEGESLYQLKKGKITHHTARFRIVAVYNYELGAWHRYVTNAPPEMLPAESISAVYAARWEIELLFRELKTAYRVGDMPSGNLHATETLLYSAVLTLLVSRRLHRVVAMRSAMPPSRLPTDRWARIFATVAGQLLQLVTAKRGQRRRDRSLLDFLRREAPDPNRSRKLLPQRSQDGEMAFA